MEAVEDNVMQNAFIIADKIMQNAMIIAKEHDLTPIPVDSFRSPATALSSAATTAQNFRLSAPSSAATTTNNFRQQFVLDRPPTEVPRTSVFGQSRAKRNASVIEMLEYVKALDIDPVKEGDLLWIAEDAFSAPLPPNWDDHLDDEGRVYYHNDVSGESAWIHPMDDTFRQIVQFQRDVISNGGFWYLDDLLHQQEDDIRENLQSWMELFDEHGEKFFYNNKTSESTYNDPRVVAYHDFYYKIKAISKMKEKFPLLARAPRPPSVTKNIDEMDKIRAEEEIIYLKAICKLQSYARMIDAKRRVRIMRERRMFRDGKGMQGVRLSITKDDAGQNVVVLAMTTKARRDKAATKIQCFFRGQRTRKRVMPMMEHVRYQNKLLTPIQCQARIWLAKRKVARLRWARQEASVRTIQRLFRGHVGRKYVRAVKRENALQVLGRESAIRIQCAIRQKLSRQTMKTRRREVHTKLALVVQRFVRRYVDKKKLLRMSMMKNPVTAQLEFNDEDPMHPWFIGSRMAPLDEEGTWLSPPFDVHPLFRGDNDIWGEYFEDSARTLQRYARGFLSRIRTRKRRRLWSEMWQLVDPQLMDQIENRHGSAIKLQSRTKGHLLRKHDVLKDKFLSRFAPNTPGHQKLSRIQASVRSFLAQHRMLQRGKDEKYRVKATKIQSRWRGSIGRQHVASLRAETLWPLKGWFSYTVTGSTSSSCVRCAVQFLPNTAFDNDQYVAAFGNGYALPEEEFLQERDQTIIAPTVGVEAGIQTLPFDALEPSFGDEAHVRPLLSEVPQPNEGPSTSDIDEVDMEVVPQLLLNAGDIDEIVDVEVVSQPILTTGDLDDEVIDVEVAPQPTTNDLDDEVVDVEVAPAPVITTSDVDDEVVDVEVAPKSISDTGDLDDDVVDVEMVHQPILTTGDLDDEVVDMDVAPLHTGDLDEVVDVEMVHQPLLTTGDLDDQVVDMEVVPRLLQTGDNYRSHLHSHLLVDAVDKDVATEVELAVSAIDAATQYDPLEPEPDTSESGQGQAASPGSKAAKQKPRKAKPTKPGETLFKFVDKPSLTREFFQTAQGYFSDCDAALPSSPAKSKKNEVIDLPQKAPDELPPVRPPSRKIEKPDRNLPASASYAGKLVGGKFVRNNISNVNKFTKEEKYQLFRDMEKAREQKAVLLKERQQQHVLLKKEREEDEKRRLLGYQAEYEEVKRERSEKLVCEVKKWMARKDKEEMLKKAHEKKILDDLQNKRIRRKAKEEQWEMERQMMRERNMVLVAKKKDMLDAQIMDAHDPSDAVLKECHVHHHVHYHHGQRSDGFHMRDTLEEETEKTVEHTVGSDAAEISHLHYHVKPSDSLGEFDAE